MTFHEVSFEIFRVQKADLMTTYVGKVYHDISTNLAGLDKFFLTKQLLYSKNI